MEDCAIGGYISPYPSYYCIFLKPCPNLPFSPSAVILHFSASLRQQHRYNGISNVSKVVVGSRRWQKNIGFKQIMSTMKDTNPTQAKKKRKSESNVFDMIKQTPPLVCERESFSIKMEFAYLSQNTGEAWRRGHRRKWWSGKRPGWEGSGRGSRRGRQLA